MIVQVRPAQLAAWIASHASGAGGAVVLDVREDWERQMASVQAQGFELVNMPMGTIPSRLGELDPRRPLAVLCHHGNRSQRVAMFLAQQGFGVVANIAGGIDAWSNELDPGVPRY